MALQPGSSAPGRSTKPGRAEVQVFRTFLSAHVAITKLLEAELLEIHQMSLASFDVLVQLRESPGRRLRMAELADAVLLSRSGVSRIVEKLEKDGLVTRQPADGDGRGVIAELTDKGSERFAEAAATHLRGIEEYFVSRLTPVELAAVDLIFRRFQPVFGRQKPPTNPD